MLSCPALEQADALVFEDLEQQRLPARAMVAALRQAGLTAQLVSFGQDSDPETIVALACRLQPRLIVLSLIFGHLLLENVRLAERLRAAGVAAHVAMAGPLPVFIRTDLLSSCRALDSVLLGDPEPSVTQLAAALVRGVDCTSLPGVASRAINTSAQQRDVPVCDLDALPLVARDDGIPSYHSVGFATLESSRGCYHACSFCLPCACYQPATRAPYRLRSIPHLAGEIQQLHRRGVRLFLFDDEQFLPPGQARAERVTALGTELRRRRLDIAFTIKCRPDDVESELFQRLKDIGLCRVYLGLESGCQTTLDILNKRVTVDQNVAALSMLDRLGIVADFRCLMFHPWSTFDTLRAEVDFLQAMLPSVPTAFSFHEVECFPGTAIHERMLKEVQEDAARWPCAGPGPFLPSWSYVLADPRAELLRRTSRRVFQGCRSGEGIVGRTTEAWYSILLSQRFWPRTGLARQSDALRGLIKATNLEMLDVWRGMISFAEDSDPCEGERISQKESVWIERLSRLETHVSQQLETADLWARRAP